jgi:hypothetical protein
MGERAIAVTKSLSWLALAGVAYTLSLPPSRPTRPSVTKLLGWKPLCLCVRSEQKRLLGIKASNPASLIKSGRNWRTPEPKGGGSGVLGGRQKGVKSARRWWCRGESRGKPLHQVYYLLFLSLWIERRVCKFIKPLISLPTVAIRTSRVVIGRLCLAIFVILLWKDVELVITL